MGDRVHIISGALFSTLLKYGYTTEQAILYVGNAGLKGHLDSRVCAQCGVWYETGTTLYGLVFVHDVITF